MEDPSLIMDQVTYEQKEHLLLAYYDRLKQIDENNRALTSYFFGVDTAILALILQLFRDSWEGVILATLGYFTSVALVLIGYKSFWSWRAYAKEMKGVEDALGYDISAKYDMQINDCPAKAVRVTIIRLRFNSLFLLLWVFFVPYLVFSIPAPWMMNAPVMVFFGTLLVIAILCLPWVFLLGSLHWRMLRAVLGAPWARDV